MQVIYSTKYCIRKESTRDHIDLLLSMRHWAVVYAVDMACDVVAHLEARHPALAHHLWRDRRGCFQRPNETKKSEVISQKIQYHVQSRLIVTGSGKRAHLAQVINF